VVIKILDYNAVLSLQGKVFVSERVAGVVSVRRHQKLPPSQTKTVPASSKKDLPLARAETISKAGSAFVINI